jgi:CelD/BcsL family acetyltransferase involved in cellulose biosynthesis
MTYDAIPARELSPDLIERWSTIQGQSASFASPYFRPEFTQAVAAVRNDVFIGLLAHESRIVGFFPFHRKRGGVARPIGLGLSDYHGVIAEPGTEWTAEGLMQGCKLVRWDFNHLLADQRQFAPYYSAVAESPIIDVSQGFEAFEESRDRAGRKYIAEVQRKRKKLGEQVGPLSFTCHSANRDVLRQMMAWKSAQCRRTGSVDFFSLAWCVRLIERIHDSQEPGFGGILACLHAGDTLVAVHFAMYASRVWHSWFPAYNHELDEYSPGSILLLEMIKSASEKGIEYIDLGKGLPLYKKRVMTGAIPVAEGCVETPSFINRLRALRGITERRMRDSFLFPVFRFPGRMLKRLESKGRYR